MHVLCVCRQGRDRSKYLAEYLSEKGYAADYGGIDPHATKRLEQAQLDWADIIIVVRTPILEELKTLYRVPKKRLIVLEIPGVGSADWPAEALMLPREKAKEQYVYPEIRRQIAPHLPL
jgi:predicted protein tyrosine phosphatase